MEISVEAHLHGPLFQLGTPENIMARYRHMVGERLADEGQRRIRAYLPTQYMYLGHSGGDPKHNPVPRNAGFLQENVHVDVVTTDRAIITTDPVIYGAWIEGTAYGNEIIWKGRLRRGLPGRFPGYHTFRIVSQELNTEAKDIAYSILPTYIAELNA